MNDELLTKSSHKKEAYRRWKQGQVTREEHRNTVQACRDTVRTATAQLKLDLVRDVKGNKMGFCKYKSDKCKTRENVGPLPNETGDLVRQDIEKAEVLNAVFASIFTSKANLQESQAPEPRRKSGARQSFP